MKRVAGTLLFLAHSAWGGWVLEQELTDDRGGDKVTSYYEGTKYRIDIKGEKRNTSTLFQGREFLYCQNDHKRCTRNQISGLLGVPQQGKFDDFILRSTGAVRKFLGETCREYEVTTAVSVEIMREKRVTTTQGRECFLNGPKFEELAAALSAVKASVLSQFVFPELADEFLKHQALGPSLYGSSQVTTSGYGGSSVKTLVWRTKSIKETTVSPSVFLAPKGFQIVEKRELTQKK